MASWRDGTTGSRCRPTALRAQSPSWRWLSRTRRRWKGCWWSVGGWRRSSGGSPWQAFRRWLVGWNFRVTLGHYYGATSNRTWVNYPNRLIHCRRQQTDTRPCYHLPLIYLMRWAIARLYALRIRHFLLGEFSFGEVLLRPFLVEPLSVLFCNIYFTCLSVRKRNLSRNEFSTCISQVSWTLDISNLWSKANQNEKLNPSSPPSAISSRWIFGLSNAVSS